MHLEAPSHPFSDDLRAWLESDPVFAERVVRAVAARITGEIRATGGWSGIAMRASLATLETFRPGFVESAVRALLPECGAALTRHYQRYLLSGSTEGFAAWVEAHVEDVAADLKAVLDARIARHAHRVPASAVRQIRRSLDGRLRYSLLGLAGLVDEAVALKT